MYVCACVFVRIPTHVQNDLKNNLSHSSKFAFEADDIRINSSLRAESLYTQFVILVCIHG